MPDPRSASLVAVLPIANGADLARIHDVPEMIRVATIADAITRYA